MANLNALIKNQRNAVLRFVKGLNNPSKAANLQALQQSGESVSSFIIRRATAADVPALATLHVTTWNETYFSKRSPTYHVREYQWRQQFENANGGWFVFVIEKSNGELVGFAKGQCYSHSDLPQFKGELNKIYVLRKYQRLGLGKKLLAAIAMEFVEMHIYKMVLFGTAANPTCRFYEVMGGERIYAKNGEFHGGYGFNNLSMLIP